MRRYLLPLFLLLFLLAGMFAAIGPVRSASVLVPAPVELDQVGVALPARLVIAEDTEPLPAGSSAVSTQAGSGWSDPLLDELNILHSKRFLPLSSGGFETLALTEPASRFDITPRRLTLEQVIEILAVHWPEAHMQEAINIASCESSFTTWQDNDETSSRGLFQIHPGWFDEWGWHYENGRKLGIVEALGYEWVDMLNPEVNAHVAFEIWSRSGWHPWECLPDGSVKPKPGEEPELVEDDVVEVVDGSLDGGDGPAASDVDFSVPSPPVGSFPSTTVPVVTSPPVSVVPDPVVSAPEPTVPSTTVPDPVVSAPEPTIPSTTVPSTTVPAGPASTTTTTTIPAPTTTAAPTTTVPTTTTAAPTTTVVADGEPDVEE